MSARDDLTALLVNQGLVGDGPDTAIADAILNAGWVPAERLAKVHRRSERWEKDCIETTRELLAVRRDLADAQAQSDGYKDGLATFRSMWRDEKATVQRVRTLLPTTDDEWERKSYCGTITPHDLRAALDASEEDGR